MDIDKMRNDLSIRGKNGLPFLMAATIIWLIITVIYFQSGLDIKTKNIFMFIFTGLMLPLAVGFSKVIKAEWKFDHPLGNLGLLFNLAQFIYFPIIFWAFIKSPSEMVVFFAIITGAHLLPYGWFYNVRAYYILAPVTSLLIFLLSLQTSIALWFIPLVMAALLVILSICLYVDYKSKKRDINGETSINQHRLHV